MIKIQRTITIGMMILIALSGCGSTSVNADKELVCMIESELDSATYVSEVVIEYNEEEDTMIHGKFHEKYEGLDKTDTNNTILQRFMDNQSLLEGAQGVKLSLDVTDTSFDYQEEWDYQDIDLQEILDLDNRQKNFVEDDKYRTEKVTDYYTLQGYSCEINDIK